MSPKWPKRQMTKVTAVLDCGSLWNHHSWACTQKKQLAHPVACLLNCLCAQLCTHLTTCKPKLTKQSTYLWTQKNFRYLSTTKVRKCSIPHLCSGNISNNFWINLMKRKMLLARVYEPALWAQLVLGAGAEKATAGHLAAIPSNKGVVCKKRSFFNVDKLSKTRF